MAFKGEEPKLSARQPALSCTRPMETDAGAVVGGVVVVSVLRCMSGRRTGEDACGGMRASWWS